MDFQFAVRSDAAMILRRVFFRPGRVGAPLEGITFDYFDEVWVYSQCVPVVLRLSDDGAQTAVHWLNR